MVIKFAYVVDLLARLEALETLCIPLSRQRRHTQSATIIKTWFRSHSVHWDSLEEDFSALLSILLPSNNTNRSCDFIIQRLERALPRWLCWCSSDLVDFASRRTAANEDFASIVAVIQSRNDGRTLRHDFTVADISEAIKRIAAWPSLDADRVQIACDDLSSHSHVISSIVSYLPSLQLKWFIRLVLRDISLLDTDHYSEIILFLTRLKPPDMTRPYASSTASFRFLQALDSACHTDTASLAAEAEAEAAEWVRNPTTRQLQAHSNVEKAADLAIADLPATSSTLSSRQVQRPGCLRACKNSQFLSCSDIPGISNDLRHAQRVRSSHTSKNKPNVGGQIRRQRKDSKHHESSFHVHEDHGGRCPRFEIDLQTNTQATTKHGPEPRPVKKRRTSSQGGVVQRSPMSVIVNESKPTPTTNSASIIAFRSTEAGEERQLCSSIREKHTQRTTKGFGCRMSERCQKRPILRLDDATALLPVTMLVPPEVALQIEPGDLEYCFRFVRHYTTDTVGWRRHGEIDVGRADSLLTRSQACAGLQRVVVVDAQSETFCIARILVDVLRNKLTQNEQVEVWDFGAFCQWSDEVHRTCTGMVSKETIESLELSPPRLALVRRNARGSGNELVGV